MVGDEARLPAEFKLDDWHELKADVHGVDTYCYLDGKHVLDFSFRGSLPPWYSANNSWPEDLTHGRVGLWTNKVQAEFEGWTATRLTDFSHIVTPQTGRRDRQGGLLARQSYAETMRQFTEWMLDSDRLVDKDKVPAPIRNLPPYLIANFVNSEDQIYDPGGRICVLSHSVYLRRRSILRLYRRPAPHRHGHSIGRLAYCQQHSRRCSFAVFASEYGCMESGRNLEVARVGLGAG
jgi:hypothetical protein